MTKISRLPSMVQRASAALVLGVGCSFVTASAAERSPGERQPPARTAATAVVHDVALDREGRLTGCVTDVQGAAVRRVAVLLERVSPTGRTLTAKLETDDAGRFQTQPLTGGAYVATSAGGQSAVRVWKAAAAPPAAAAGVLIVADEQSVRGQSSTSKVYEFLEERPAITYAAIAAAIVVPIVEIADNERKRGS